MINTTTNIQKLIHCTYRSVKNLQTEIYSTAKTSQHDFKGRGEEEVDKERVKQGRKGQDEERE